MLNSTGAKMNKVNIVNEVNGYEESLSGLKAYEEKYGISTADFMKGSYTCTIPARDECIWEFYAECYIECGGVIEGKENEDDDTASAAVHEELFFDQCNEKGGDFKTSPPFSI